MEDLRKEKDRKKGCLSGVFFMFAFTLPLVGLIAGWIGWGLKIGVVAAFGTFALFFILGGIMAIFIRKPSWFIASLPLIIGMWYSAFNVIPLPFDDVLVACAGAILSFALYLKRYNAPKWIVIPLLASGLYTLVGEFIPTPIDEFLVAIIGIGTATAASGKPKELLAPEVQEIPPHQENDEEA